MAKLENGYNVVIQQKVGTTNKPIYPFTHSANVIDANGDSMDTVISGILAKNYVPDYSSEAASSLRFLRNDNTWATIQSASTSQAGVVVLTSALNSDSETTAATAAAAKSLKDAIDLLNGAVTTEGSVLKAIKDNAKNATYAEGVTIAQAIANAEAAAKTAGVVDVVKQATAETGYASTYYVTQAGVQVGAKINIPKDYLVKSCSVKTCTEADKPVEGYKVGDKYIDFVVNTATGTGDESHIYLLVNELVDVYTGKAVTDGISVAIDDHNEVSATVSGKAIARANVTDEFEANIAALEGTHATDADGKFKSVATQISEEAKNATYTEDKTISAALDDIYAQIGEGGSVAKQISDAINALDSTVTQTAGADGVSATVVETDGKLTSVTVAQTAATASANGYMTKEYAAKLDNCMETVVSATEPTFASGAGLWMKVVSED